jgi:phage gpG-like protein
VARIPAGQTLVSVVKRVDNLDALVKSVEALTKKEVLIGIPQSNAARANPGPSNALLGYWHEFGAPGANIPARPFLFPAIRKSQERIVKILFTAAQKIGKGEAITPDVDKAMNSVGLIASTEAKKIITAGIPPPLKAATLAARRRKKFTGTKPLIVTGSLLRSITYVVRVRSK